MSIRSEAVEKYRSLGYVSFIYGGLYSPGYDWQNSTTDDELDPDENENPIALLLGKPSGLAVIDVDVQNGGSVQALFDRYGKDELDTYLVQTASGGYHLYFSYPDVDELRGVIDMGRIIPELKGIDFLADGRHVIAPPTVRVGHPTKTDGSYHVVRDSEVKELPDKVLEDWQSATVHREPGEATGKIEESKWSWATQVHQANLDATINAEPGSRDNTTFARICSSVRIAKSVPDQVLTVEKVKQDYQQQVPYEIKSLSGKFDRAIQFANAHPWEELTPALLQVEIPDYIRPQDVWAFLQELAKTRIRDGVKEVRAREQIEKAAEDAGRIEIFSGNDFMSQTVEHPKWVIENLLQYEGKMLLAAQFKVGKSSLMVDAIHALTTGSKFLGEFEVPEPKKVAFIDLELGRYLVKEWVAKSGADVSKLHIVPMLGRGKALDTRSDAARQNIARQLMQAGVEVLIIDPLSPVLSSLGIDENSAETVRPLLDSFDALAVEAGLSGMIVTHHAGHGDKARARGSSAFSDWPSTLMTLERSDPARMDSQRYFSAFGRDVNVTRQPLEFDHTTNKFTIADWDNA